MEKISAACAMEWSIELDKALRSKNPGRAAEAISQIGPRLEQWNEEQEPTMVVYNMFGLVPGEDRLFANTILLRLADAFRFGDKCIRLAVVKLFLSVLRQNRQKKRSKRLKGILSKLRVHNHLELLTRVKTVYDAADVESKAMALVLFGCWADFAKDSAQTRSLIFRSLVSSHALEVRASLFAGGCFSELADDFANVLLEKVVDMVTLQETVPSIRLAGVRVFAKMGSSHSIVCKAYKTGLKLMCNSSEEYFLVAMLVSLSKLASNSTVLASEQVGILLSFLDQEKTENMQAIVLRCLHFIFIKGICNFPVSEQLIRTLISILDKPELQPRMQSEALQILQKILSYNLHSIDPSEFSELLTFVENVSQTPVMLKSVAAIRVVVHISLKIFERPGMSEVSSSPLLLQVATLLIDQISLMGKGTSDVCQTLSGVFQEVQSMLKLLLRLVREHPDLGEMVLDKIILYIESFVNMATKEASALVHQIEEHNRERGTAIRSKILYYVNRFLVAFLEILSVAGAMNSQVFDKVKLVVECIYRCGLFDCYTQIIYFILLHSQVIWGCTKNKEEKTCTLNETSDIFLLMYGHEILTLECAKKMLTERDYWLAYRAGIHATYQGAWVTATYIFEHLITKVQSDSSYRWLKSLGQFALSEGKIQLLPSPEGNSCLVNWLKKNKSPGTSFEEILGEMSKDSAGNNNELNCSQVLLGAYHSLCSSENILESIDTSNRVFCFQRWFLAVRARILGNIVDLLKVLGLPDVGNINNRGHEEKSFLVGCKSLQQITQISVRLKSLAQNLDLIAMSFTGMGNRSLAIIAALALSCSTLAFAAGFALFIPKLLAYVTLTACGSESSQNCLRSSLIQNLVARLWHVDPETCIKLCQLLEINAQPKNCFHMQSRNQILSTYGEVRDILSICSYAVHGIVDLQNEANRVHNGDLLSQITNCGLHLLLDITKKCIHVPFRSPKIFFRIRPCIGSELFASGADTRNMDGICVLPGFHLSLNLCLQLRNWPPGLPFHVKKLYCLLYCRVSFQVSKQNGEKEEDKQWGFPAQEMDEMIETNQKLFQHVTELAKKTTNSNKFGAKNDGETAHAFVCFEPNERGQGFSSCLLDVSHFPVGSYQIKWHSCCTDSQASYWSLLPMNSGPVFTIQQSSVVG